MNYLYHLVPENIKGDTLFPLNELRNKYPMIYKKELKKYEGRSHIFNIRIPILNCGWNDVIHFVAIHPKKIKEALIKAGFHHKKMKWYKLNPKLLNKKLSIIYLYKDKPHEERYSISSFASYNLSKLPNFSRFPKKTLNYYKESFKKRQKPLLFHFIPHILYKGGVSVKDAEIIEA